LIGGGGVVESRLQRYGPNLTKFMISSLRPHILQEL
jgi:hypothetical protein